MKTMKKTLSLVLAIVMALALAMPAMAEETYTITVPNSDTHEYQVFQILTGDLNGDKDTLSNASWGSSVTATDGKVNGKTVNEFMKLMEGVSGNDAVELAMTYFDTAKPLSGTVKAGTPMGNLAEGYYILVDVTTPLTNTDANDKIISTDTKALSLLQLVDNVTVEKKWGTTQDTKTITSDTLGKDGTAKNEYNPGEDTDNVSIGDKVTYKIEAVVPENADKFDAGTFFFVISDKMSAGLTFNNDIAVALSDGTELTETTNYSVKTGDDSAPDTFQIALISGENYAGQTIVVTYSATVNENAVIGEAGNPNTSKVQFSNDPNKTYDGTTTPGDEDHPGFPKDWTKVPNGETPESETITYVTGIEILKVDENGNPLTQDVTFKLSGQSVKKVVNKTVGFTEAADGEYYKLTDGTYTKDEPITANSMKPAEAGANEGWVKAEDDYAGTDTETVGGVVYRPYKPDTDAGKDIFILVKANADKYQDTTTKYKKTTSFESTDVMDGTTAHNVSASPDANGYIRFDGLGAGTYTIEETQWPDGYNKASDISLTVSYDENGTPKFSVTGGTATYDADDGVIKIQIVNEKGGTLPETGGIGTKIFYTMGAVLVIGAGVVLVSRKRAGE